MNIAGTKKIIAREGLIILSIIFLIIVIAIIPNQIILKDSKTPIDLLTQTRVAIEDNGSGINYTVIFDKKDVEQKVSGYDATRVDAIKELARRGKFQSMKKDLNIAREEFSTESFKWSLFVFGFLLYPLYLVVRFIAWAIKTLKKK